MGKHQTSSPSSSSNLRQWQRIFKTMVEMLQSQQSQIETLADDREFLQKYIHIQHDYWSSRTRDFESHIAQLKKEESKGRKIQTSKLDLIVEMKQREVLCYKKLFESAETDLEDFRVCVEAFSAELLELKEKLKDGEAGKSRTGVGDSGHVENSKEKEWSAAALKGEIRKLKHSYKKLSSKKVAEVSALLAEKDFVWNQLKKMESDYTAILKSKRTEVDHANEAIGKLQHNLEDLQTSATEKDKEIAALKARYESDMKRHTQVAEAANGKIEQLQLDMEEIRSLVKEKDETIAKLRSDHAKLEMDMHKCTDGKARFAKELFKDASATPLRSSSRKGSRKRSSESAKDDADKKRRCVYDGSSQSRVSALVHGPVRCSSRLKTMSASPKERPALFHANFKVPKLKNLPCSSLIK